MRIGVPTGLMYSRYGSAWQAFLTSLGHECIVAPATNRAMLDEGCRLAVDETCLSVKTYLGQVAWLARRTDAVLVPRFVSVRRRERECVKLWGIHDIARNTLPDANIIGYSVDASGLSHKANSPMSGLHQCALSLGATPVQALTATARALFAEKADRLKAAASRRVRQRSDAPRILVVGHGYNLHDEMIGAPVLRGLKELGCEVIEADEVPEGQARRRSLRVSPGLQWTNNRHLLGAVDKLARRVDGIILIIAFPCGPDSMVAEVLTRAITNIPVVTLVLDEHSGAGGLRTRIESFVDIVAMRKRANQSHRIAVQEVPGS